MVIQGLQTFKENSMWVLSGLKYDALYLADKCAKIIDKQFKFQTEKLLDKLFFNYQPFGKMTDSDIQAALNTQLTNPILSLQTQFNTLLKTDQFVLALKLFGKTSMNQNDTHLLTLQKNVLNLVEKRASRFSLFTIMSKSEGQAAVIEFCGKKRAETYTDKDIPFLIFNIVEKELLGNIVDKKLG